MLSYKRILLKLSGEALMGDKQSGIDEKRLLQYAQQIKEAADQGVEIGIVIGGGNIFRGMSGQAAGFDRVKGDYMGMLATTINGLAIQSAMESLGSKCTLITAIEMKPVGIRYSKQIVQKAFEHDEIVAVLYVRNMKLPAILLKLFEIWEIACETKFDHRNCYCDSEYFVLRDGILRIMRCFWLSEQSSR